MHGFCKCAVAMATKSCHFDKVTGLVKFKSSKIVQILYCNKRFGQFYQMFMPHLYRLKKQPLEYENLALIIS